MSDSTPTISRRLGWRLTAWAYDALAFALRRASVDAASAFGAAVVGLLGPLTSKHAIVLRNLELAFPEMDPGARRALAHDFWRLIGRTFAEFPLMDRITPGTGRVEVEGMERLHALAAAGTPAILVSGHLSNWEPMMATIVASGLPCRVSYRPANNPDMDRRIIESRARYGVQLFAARGGDGTRGLLAALNQGQAVAMLNDQRDSSGAPGPFFGRTVWTAAGPARLALRYGGRLIPMSVRRTRGARFVVTIHEPIVLERTGDKAGDLALAVARINAFIEARIRERPAEWFWAHRRWPVELYAAPEAMAPLSSLRRQGPV